MHDLEKAQLNLRDLLINFNYFIRLFLFVSIKMKVAIAISYDDDSVLTG